MTRRNKYIKNKYGHIEREIDYKDENQFSNLQTKEITEKEKCEARISVKLLRSKLKIRSTKSLGIKVRRNVLIKDNKIWEKIRRTRR